MAQFALTTLARVKVQVQAGGKKLGDTWDSWIAAAIVAYSAEAERLMNRPAEATERTEYFDVSIGQRQSFLLRAVPVSAVSSVRSDTDRDFAASDEVDSDSYTFDPENGILYVDGVVLEGGIRALKVTYTGGLGADLDAVLLAHADVVQAVETQIVYHSQRLKSLGKSGSGGAGGSVSWIGALDLLPAVRKTLLRRRLPVRHG